MPWYEYLYLGVLFYSLILSFILIFGGAKQRRRAPINIGCVNLLCTVFAPLMTYAYVFGDGENGRGIVAVLESMGTGNIIALIVVAANAFIIYTYVYAIYYVSRKPERRIYD